MPRLASMTAPPAARSGVPGSGPLTRPFTSPRPASYATIPRAPRLRDCRDHPLPPGPRPRLPGLLTLRFQRDTPRFLRGLRDEYGDAVSFVLAGQVFIGLFAPAMVHEVLVAQQSAFVKGVGFARMRKVLGEGLLTNEEPIHMRHRRMMQPPFQRSRLDGYATLMSDLAREHIATWRDGSVIALAPAMMRLTLLIVAQTLFGTDARHHTDRITESMDIAIDRIERTMLPGLDRLDSLPLPYWRAFHRAADDLSMIAEELIAHRRGSMAGTPQGEPADDLLGLLLALRDEDGSGFTDEEVRDEALTLILSGHETTANALTWAFSWLAGRPDLAAALREEAASLPERIGVAEAMSASVAGQVVNESLRLAPPVWVAPRRALRDVTVAGVPIPAGAHVLVSQYVTHRDPLLYPQPDQWLPQRWSDGLITRLPKGAYFPFGAGSRKCLGDRFALVEARIILLMAARHCSLSPADPRRPLPRAQPRATYRALGAVPMRVSCQ